MISNGLQLCWEALERLKSNTPLNPHFKGVKLTNSIVSKEAGLDAGYLKSSRANHQALIQEINDYNEDLKDNHLRLKIEKLQLDIAKLKEQNKELTLERDNALGREILLYNHICELEDHLLTNNVSVLKPAWND